MQRYVSRSEEPERERERQIDRERKSAGETWMNILLIMKWMINLKQANVNTPKRKKQRKKEGVISASVELDNVLLDFTAL